MKILLGTLFIPLLGCGSTRNVVGDAPAPKSASDCASTCEADVSCTPDGHCLITCTNDAGERCEIELACNGTSCEVVRSDCPDSCCADQAKTAAKH